MASMKLINIILEQLNLSEDQQFYEQDFYDEKKTFLYLLGRQIIEDSNEVITEINNYKLNDEELDIVFQGMKYAFNEATGKSEKLNQEKPVIRETLELLDILRENRQIILYNDEEYTAVTEFLELHESDFTVTEIDENTHQVHLR